MWRHHESGGWQQDGPALAGHADWVRDVAWAPNLGLPANTLASAGQDGRVFVWAEQAGGGWERTLLQDFQARAQPQTCSVQGFVRGKQGPCILRLARAACYGQRLASALSCRTSYVCM